MSLSLVSVLLSSTHSMSSDAEGAGGIAFDGEDLLASQASFATVAFQTGWVIELLHHFDE